VDVFVLDNGVATSRSSGQVLAVVEHGESSRSRMKVSTNRFPGGSEAPRERLENYLRSELLVNPNSTMHAQHE
jgi:hypothetical protein